MQEIVGNLWNYHKKGFWIVVPTNGIVKEDGEAVMGRGLALQAKVKFPEMPSELGMSLKECGNEICLFYKYHIITFPVKHNWWEKSNSSRSDRSSD